MTPSEAVEAYGTKAAAARAMNIPVTTFKDRFDRERLARRPSATVLEFPVLPDVREPLDKLLERRFESYQRKVAYRKAATWQQIKVADDKPYGLALLGDPHLDDDGCAWPELMADVEIMRGTPGMHAINIGDTTNNWVGRLARLFGNQETSQTSARQLAEHFLTGMGISWAAVLLGNHDEWNEGGEIIRRMCAGAKGVTIPVHDWLAKLEFVSPNGAAFRGNFAHDFKGRSIYSTTHGPLREAIWMQDGAHLYAAGHIHYGGLQQVELPGGHNPWLVRVKGYKDDDHHALVNGFHEGQRFRSALAVIEPRAPEHERCMVFGSLRQGQDVLRSLRGDRTIRRKPQPTPPANRKARKQARKAKRGRK
jgi:hypothetical protein